MANVVTQADYARMRGISKQAMGKLVSAGTVPLIDGLVDVDVADLKILQNCNPAKSKAARLIRAERGQPVSAVPAAALPASTTHHPVGASAAGLPSFQTSREFREHYAALREQMLYEQDAKTLVERDAVEKGVFGVMRMLRDRLLVLPRSLAQRVAAESDVAKIDAMIEEEIRSLLESTAKALQASIARVTAPAGAE